MTTVITNDNCSTTCPLSAGQPGRSAHNNPSCLRREIWHLAPSSLHYRIESSLYRLVHFTAVPILRNIALAQDTSVPIQHVIGDPLDGVFLRNRIIRMAVDGVETFRMCPWSRFGGTIPTGVRQPGE